MRKRGSESLNDGQGATLSARAGMREPGSAMSASVVFPVGALT